MRAGGYALPRPAIRPWSLAMGLLPMLAGCAALGFPGNPPPPLPAPLSAPAPSATEADLLVRPDAAPPPEPASPPAPTPGPRQYEVLGERYTVMESADDYVEVGEASWYGRELAGRRTASGERFDPNGMTAAHRTLPLSTWVEVTNLENGRSVVLRVNDRGPFADTDVRIIDVSYGAARVLGLIGPGTAQVEVKAVPPPRRERR